MLYWMTESTGTMLTVPQLRHAIRRNFSGFSASDEFNPFNYFVEQFPDLDEVNSIFMPIQQCFCYFRKARQLLGVQI